MTYQEKRDERNGILNFKATEPMTGYWRYWPSAEFAPYVEHYWTVEWDLPKPELRETLPYPAAHIIFEPGVARWAAYTPQDSAACSKARAACSA